MLLRGAVEGAGLSRLHPSGRCRPKGAAEQFCPVLPGVMRGWRPDLNSLKGPGHLEMSRKIETAKMGFYTLLGTFFLGLFDFILFCFIVFYLISLYFTSLYFIPFWFISFH